MAFSSNKNTTSGKYNGIKRRNYLRTIGTTSISVLGLVRSSARADTASDLSNHLIIKGTGTRADYAFTVSGSVEPLEVNSHDTVRSDGAEGLVGGGDDRYNFSGDLVAFGLNGTATVRLNGETLDPGDYPDILTIEGSGVRSDYSFTVSGSVEPLEVNSHDTVRSDGAEGLVGGGDDRYAINGDLRSLRLEGNAVVSLNGEAIDPATYPDAILTIEGSGTRSEYSFMASENVEPLQINNHDTVHARGAKGLVGGGDDRYAIDGDLVALDLDGTATVRFNSETVDPGTYPDAILIIKGTGTRADYAFTVSGSVEPLEVNSHDTVRSDGAEGLVGSGDDRYAVSGDFSRFALDGDADVYINDGRIDYNSLGGNDGGTGNLKLGYNARERSHSRGNPYENFADLSGWRAERGRLVSNSDWDGNDGGCSTLVGTTSENRIRMAADFNSENFAYRDPSVAVRLRGPAHETLRVELWADTSDDQFATSRYLSEKHGWVRLPISPTAINGDPDLADIDRITIECYTGGKDIRIDVDDIRTTRKRDNGAVLFIFDDGNETDYTVAYDELSARGWVGSSAVIPGLVGGQGTLSGVQMDEMHADGWAFSNHPQGDTPADGLGSISGDRAERIMRENKRWLLDNGYERGADTIVWPFGDFDREALQIAGDYYRLAWGGGSSTANGVVTEAGWVPRVELNEGNDVANALDAIDYAHRTDTVLSFMTHGMGGNNIGRADFNRVLDRIAFRDLDVLTTSDFADEQ